MPKLNLKEGGPEEELRALEESSDAAPPVLEEEEPARRGPSALVQVLIALGFLALVTVALNYFGVIRLWGPGEPKVAETVPPPTDLAPPVVQEPVQPTPSEPPVQPGTSGTVTPTPSPTPTPVPGTTGGTAPAPAQPAPKPVTPPAAQAAKPPAPAEPAPVRPTLPPSVPAGRWTVQVSSWLTMGKARAEVNRLTAAGFDAFISRAEVAGETRFRVRVGRYGTEREAATALAGLRKVIENGLWIARESGN
jgi:cell division septation protein DedD